MAKKPSYLAASKGKKKRSYSMDIKKQFVVYAEANSNRCAALHFDWSRSVQENGRRTLKSTKPNRQRLDGAGRKWIDENLEENLAHWIYEKGSKMLHVSRKMIMWKPTCIFHEKTTILPSKNHLLLVVHGVKSLCAGMSSLLEEKLQLLRRIHCIWLNVS